MAQDDGQKTIDDIDLDWGDDGDVSAPVPVAAAQEPAEAPLELVVDEPQREPADSAPELEVGGFEYAEIDIDEAPGASDASPGAELESGLHAKDAVARAPSIPELSLEPPTHAVLEGPPATHISEGSLPVQGVRAPAARPQTPPAGLQPPELGPPRQRAPSLELDEISLDLDDAPAPLEAPAAEPAQPVGFELASDHPPAADDPALRDLKDRYAMGDYSGALVVAEGLLEDDPEDLEARRYAQSCRDVLVQMYSARLGPLDQVVGVAIPPDEVRWLSLDHRAGFLLSMIDGTSSVEEILDVSGMPRLDALRILHSLLEQQVISLTGGR